MSDLDEELRTGSPRRVPAVFWSVLIAVVVAGGAGYLIGAGRPAAPNAAPTATATVTAAPSSGPEFSALLDLGVDRCSAQSGHRLQLGVQLINPSGAIAKLQAVTPVFPLSGLRAVGVRAGPCGQLASPAVAGTPVLQSRQTWITITVDVRVRCPRPLPMQLDVRYTSAGRAHVVQLAAFADLGDVPYSGCRT